jgi:hypothetical protein
MLGRKVRDLIPGSWMGKGEQIMMMRNDDGMATGTYYIQIKAGDEVSRRAVSLVK